MSSSLFYRRVGQRIWRGLPLVLAVSLLLALLVYGVVRERGVVWQAHYSYFISLPDREASDDFQFDGYYALQAAELFGQTLAAWLTTPENVAAAHVEAGLVAPTGDARSVSRIVEATAVAPQLVEVTVRGATQHQVEQLSRGLQTVMQRRLQEDQAQGGADIVFSVTPTELWVGRHQVSPTVVASAVFLFVSLLGLNIIIFREGMRSL